MSLAAGTKLGPYGILGAIGAGGMGEEGQSPVIGHQSPVDDRLTDFVLTLTTED